MINIETLFEKSGEEFYEFMQQKAEKQNKETIDEETFLQLANLDPTAIKDFSNVDEENNFYIKNVGKYTKWILNKYNNQSEDILDDLSIALEIYHKFKKQYFTGFEDINKFKTYDDLIDLAKYVNDKFDLTEKPPYEDNNKKGKYSIIRDDEKWFIVALWDNKATHYWGKDTEWCIASYPSEFWKNYQKIYNNFIESYYTSSYKFNPPLFYYIVDKKEMQKIDEEINEKNFLENHRKLDNNDFRYLLFPYNGEMKDGYNDDVSEELKRQMPDTMKDYYYKEFAYRDKDYKEKVEKNNKFIEDFQDKNLELKQFFRKYKNYILDEELKKVYEDCIVDDKRMKKILSENKYGLKISPDFLKEWNKVVYDIVFNNAKKVAVNETIYLSNKYISMTYFNKDIMRKIIKFYTKDEKYIDYLTQLDYLKNNGEFFEIIRTAFFQGFKKYIKNILQKELINPDNLKQFMNINKQNEECYIINLKVKRPNFIESIITTTTELTEKVIMVASLIEAINENYAFKFVYYDNWFKKYFNSMKIICNPISEFDNTDFFNNNSITLTIERMLSYTDRIFKLYDEDFLDILEYMKKYFYFIREGDFESLNSLQKHYVEDLYDIIEKQFEKNTLVDVNLLLQCIDEELKDKEAFNKFYQVYLETQNETINTNNAV